MAGHTEEILDQILKSLEGLEYIKPEEIPNIDLYMDQVTTFMDKHLRPGLRNPGEDKILTKTMINNYAKNDLLPPPVKKKYSKEHVLLLIFIYYYKGIMSISDIQTLLGPLTEQFFQNDKAFNLEKVYEEVFSMEKEQIDALKRDIQESYRQAQDTFADAPEESRDFLREFTFICLLSFDVYQKKLIIERMIDEMRSDGMRDNRKAGKRDGKKEAKKEAKKEQKMEAKAEGKMEAKIEARIEENRDVD